MEHVARWDYPCCKTDRDPIAILKVRWNGAESEDDCIYVFRARDVRKGWYMAIADTYDDTFERQYLTLPKAEEMLQTFLNWQLYA